VLVQDARNVGKCSNSTLVSLIASMSIQKFDHPALAELLLRLMLTKDLMDLSPSGVRGNAASLQRLQLNAAYCRGPGDRALPSLPDIRSRMGG
jgi:hypothetical protein